MPRFFASLISRLNRLDTPTARKGWLFSAVLSALAAVAVLVQHFHGLPFETTIPVGPVSRIDQQQAEAGCYRWRLPPRYRSPAMEFRAVMLENGRAMSRCERMADVEEIKAAHFHVRDPMFRFRAGDGSDVRTNGRRYEVRLPLSVPDGWLAAVFGWLALSITMAVRAPLPRCLNPLMSIPSRLPAWTVALAAGLIAAWHVASHPDQSQGAFLVKGLPESDAAGWHQLAERLSEGRGLDDAFGAQRPFYAVILGTAMLMSSHSLLMAKGLNAILLGLSAMGAFALGRAMRCSWAGLGAAAFLALSDDHQILNHMVVTEPSGLAFGIVGSGALVWGLSRRSCWGCLLAGTVAGIGNLSCGELLLAVPLNALMIAALGLFRVMRPALCARLTLSFVLGVTLTMVPWMSMQKARHGVFTLSMNSAELLSGGADPVHGRLDRAMHVEANQLGFDAAHLTERYHYFGNRFASDVRGDPSGYVRRVFKATLESLDFIRTDNPMLRLLLALTMLGSGVMGVIRWRAPQPFLLSAIPLVFLATADDPWPVWWTTLPVLGLFGHRWRGRRLFALGVVMTTVIACMALCGLSGNLASRRFWNVADWGIALLWLAGLGASLRWCFAAWAKLPFLNRGMCHPSKSLMPGPAHRELRAFTVPALGLIMASGIALSGIVIRQFNGPVAKFSASAVAGLIPPGIDGDSKYLLVWFDDFSMELGSWEQVSHWLPYYQPTGEARWIARPRLIQPDGSLGNRVVIEAATADFPKPTRWQAMQCVGTSRDLRDPISGASVAVLHLRDWVPVSLSAVR